MNTTLVEPREAGMSFGRTLAALREAAGLRQADLAQRAGVSIDTLRGWEQERYLPRVDDAYRLAKALGVSIEELIRANDMEEAPAPKPRPPRPRRPEEPDQGVKRGRGKKGGGK